MADCPHWSLFKCICLPGSPQYTSPMSMCPWEKRRLHHWSHFNVYWRAWHTMRRDSTLFAIFRCKKFNLFTAASQRECTRTVSSMATHSLHLSKATVASLPNCPVLNDTHGTPLLRKRLVHSSLEGKVIQNMKMYSTLYLNIRDLSFR